MASDEPGVRPETYILDSLIRETLASVQRGGGADALLFLGNRHHAFPALVVQDPVLEPVDKLVWMVICQSARMAGQKAAFPSYERIARLANVSSTSTVSRAIAILRATRWLSLCARSRDANGRFRGSVYALHDEPLPLADALHLDPDYMRFLQDAVQHHHARVRRVAAAISASIDGDIRTGRDVLAPRNPISRRLEAGQAIRRGGRRYFSVDPDALGQLSHSDARRDLGSQHQNSKAVTASHPQNSKVVISSSNKYINTTTTTTTSTEPPDSTSTHAHEAVVLDALTIPPRLRSNQRALVARYLATIPPASRQPVLDELAGRLQAEAQGAKPVYDVLRYLHRLCRLVNQGEFVANLGLKVGSERERREREIEQRRRDVAQREQARLESVAYPPGEHPMVSIRRILGILERPASSLDEPDEPKQHN